MHSQQVDGIFAATDVLAGLRTHLAQAGIASKMCDRDLTTSPPQNTTTPVLPSLRKRKRGLRVRSSSRGIEDPEKEPATVVLPVQLIKGLQHDNTRPFPVHEGRMQ